MASWARRSLAAATSFMARVIFCVDLTDAILMRTALREGMVWRLRLHVGRELLAELAQRLLDEDDQAVPLLAAVPLGLELGPQLRVLGVDEGVQLALVAAQRIDRQGVDVAVGGGEQDHDLLLHVE